MKNFINLNEIKCIADIVEEAIQIKQSPFTHKTLGENKTLIMLFFNASLRTRISTEKAAKNLGMDVISLQINNSWKIEFTDGLQMNLDTSEHIKEAAQVLSQYADIIAVRAFPELENREYDYAEKILNGFVKYATKPVINMESATLHPLQSLADTITLHENNTKPKPKVVLSWAPHPKALPQAVPNSFVQIMLKQEVDFTITHPKGYDLCPEITKNAKVNYNQEEALQNADFVYVKNWSSYSHYGQVLSNDFSWMMTQSKLGTAKFMHCLPVRRNVVVEDSVLDGPNSLVIEQANNRTYAAQVVLKKILESMNDK